MPVNEFIDIRLTLTEKDIEELGSRIESAKEKLGSSGSGTGAGGGRQGIGKTIFAFGSNPVGFISNLIIGAAGAGMVLAITQRVLQEIQRVDKFFKQFIDIIDTRVDQLRDKQTQAEVRAGLTQIIITSAAGNVDAREAYNTYEQFNNNRAQLEADFAIRNTSGIE